MEETFFFCSNRQVQITRDMLRVPFADKTTGGLTQEETAPAISKKLEKWTGYISGRVKMPHKNRTGVKDGGKSVRPM